MPVEMQALDRTCIGAVPEPSTEAEMSMMYYHNLFSQPRHMR